MAFQKATKRQARLRMALIGPSGSGKTFTALKVAKGLGEKIAVIDTERGSASKYADQFSFDVSELETFGPLDFVHAIQEAEAAGYEVLIIDSLSHAWMGKGGALELVDAATKRSKAGNSFTAWRDVTPQHNAMVDAIVRSRCHVIITMRAKTEYLVEKDEKTGKQSVRKVGLAPIQRDGLEYECDVVGDMDNAELVITKTRCPVLKGAVIQEPGDELAKTLRGWLTDGAEATPVRAPVPATLPPALGFGSKKGTPIPELADHELSEAIGTAENSLKKDPKASWSNTMRQQLSLLKAEMRQRENGQPMEQH